MTAAPETTDVLVVGGGVAGLTASLLLERLGVDHLLVERHDGTALLPKAHVINQRAMEIYRGLDLAGDIYAAGAPPEQMSTIRWTTALAGPTPLHGRRIAQVDAWCGGDTYADASPCRCTNLPQLRLEPILRRHVDRRSPGRARFGAELTGLVDDGDRVHASVVSRASGEALDVDARFVVAADGGRTIGPSLGIEMRGERDLLDMVSTHFSADLSDVWSDESVLINFSINPAGEGSLGSGVLLPMGPDLWGAKSKEWQYHSALHAGDPDQFDTELMLQRMRDMLGLPDLASEIHSVSRWRFEGIVADHYSRGRVFLVGDSAHRHPPNGALGLNTAVGDVHNLCWKLAAVLAGTAARPLLDTYEHERRPIGLAVVAQALANWRNHPGIDRALGLEPGGSPAEGWAALDVYFGDGPQSERRRREVAAAVELAAGEFVNQAIEVGYRYDSAAVLADPGDPVVVIPPVFAKATVPGATLPHAWLRRPGSETPVSTLDLVGAGQLSLLVADTAGAPWSDAATRTCASLGLPDGSVAVHIISGDPDGPAWFDEHGSWQAHGAGPLGAVLVRPDRHVAWRTDDLPPDPAGTLTDAVRRILALDRKADPCNS